MAVIKMMMPDEDPRNKRRMVASTGAQNLNEAGEQGSKYAHSQHAKDPLSKSAQLLGSDSSVLYTQPMFFSPIHTPQNWQIASKRREIYQWARFYYENEPKVAAGVDFYAHFPMNGFKLECRDREKLEYFERFIEDIDLAEWLNHISHEYFLLGDVFPFLEIDSPESRGEKKLSPGEKPKHVDGTFRRMRVLNPDYIEVQDNVLAEEPLIVFIPDEELKMIVARQQPKQIYDKLPKRVIELVASGQPIQLSNLSVSHIKYNPSPYGTYGTSMLRRLFTILAYKTKLMTANWIVAERLILPVRVIKIGDKDRPASDDDIQDVMNQLGAVANDPNMTIVTHHAFDYEWYGACYDVNTEILTSHGWKKFAELSPDELVATYNASTGDLQYQQPEEFHEYDYDSSLYGPMYSFKAKSVDINVTPNHRMLIERDGETVEVLSQDVRPNDKLFSKVGWVGRIPATLPYKNSPLSHLSLDEYLEFVGYYLAEGGTKEDRNKGLAKDKQIQACSISQSKFSDSYKRIRASVERVYPSFSTYEDKRVNGCDLLTINSVDIARYLASEFGPHSWNKQIPRWIRNLPKDKLRILYDAMMSGNGDERNDTSRPRYRYTTTSKDLADAWSEICLKLGYWATSRVEDNRERYPNRRVVYRLFWSEQRTATKFNLRDENILREEYVGKVYCVKVPNSWLIVRRNGKVAICGNTGKIHNLTAEVEQIGKEVLDGLMLNQSLLNGEMAGYNSAQVGVETMIRRLENWRNKLANWVEKRIFLPLAMMQGFVDEEKSTPDRTVYLYPKIKWNDLNLRDKTNKVQLLLQMYDKQLVSGQTILEELGLDWDTEVERLREEQILASQSGMLPPGGQGGPGGGPGGPMGGAGGGPPGGGDMPDPMGGMGMPGGAPPMGDPAAGGPAGPPGGMPMGGAQASSQPAKVTKKGKQKEQKLTEEQQQAMAPKLMKLTKLEAKMLRELQTLNVPFKLFGQYTVSLPGNKQPYVLDFAYPEIGVGIETDGGIWHDRPDLKARDKERDEKLASYGWRVMRFTDDAVERHMPIVRDIVMKNIHAAYRQWKKASEQEGGIQKFASRVAEGNVELLDIEDYGKDVGYCCIYG